MSLSQNCSLSNDFQTPTCVFSKNNVSFTTRARSFSLGRKSSDCSVIVILCSGKTVVSVLHANLISCLVGFMLSCFYTSNSSCCVAARTVSLSV